MCTVAPSGMAPGGIVTVMSSAVSSSPSWSQVYVLMVAYVSIAGADESCTSFSAVKIRSSDMSGGELHVR